MNPEENTYCYYSDLPSPMAYMQEEEDTDLSQKVDDTSPIKNKPALKKQEENNTIESHRDE